MRATPLHPTVLAACAGLLLPLTASAQQIWHVRSDATGKGTGLSWTDAFADLHVALDHAKPGDEVWVAAGTYRPAPPNGNRDTSFALRPGVSLLGGFAGTESTRDQRNWEKNPTVLSGDLNADDADAFANTSDNAFHVVVAYDVDSNSALDGFVVRDGHANGPGFGAVRTSQEQGAGLNIYDASPTVRNCTFEDNWAANHGAVNDHGIATTYANCTFRSNYSQMFGAGLYIHNHVAASVTNCRFFANHAEAEGGGMYSRSSAGCTVSHCLFVDNTAVLGAGMYNAETSSNTITDCDFRDNLAVVGGGAIYALNAAPTILRSLFIGNAAGLHEKGGAGGGGGSGGGGVWTEGGSSLIANCFFTSNVASFGAGCYNIHDAHATITDCTFLANQAAEAGAVYSLNSPALITRCTFRSNVAAGSDFSVGGAVSHYFSNASVQDSYFEGNSAQLGGGGVYCEGVQPSVINCTFHANRAFGDHEGWGGGVLIGYFTQPLIAGCAFSANAANRGGAVFSMAFAQTEILNCTAIANSAATPDAQGGAGAFGGADAAPTRIINSIVHANSLPQLAGNFELVRRSIIQGGYTHPGADRVLDTPPGIVRMPSPGPDKVWDTADDDFGDLRLAPASRAIDAGDNAPLAGRLSTDADTNPRTVDDPGVPDDGPGDTPRVDIGAYEFQGRSCLADFNASGRIDSQDFFDFLAAFFAGAADVNRDAATNSQDFFDFLSWFFAGCER
jgi:predicted outer membrane repeat protein